MLRFCQDSHDPFFFLLLKFTQSPNSPNIKQDIVFSVDDSISIPNMSNFCIPQESYDISSEGEVRFIFYLKTNDLYPTYGYVVQLIKNQKRTAYCLLSPYYNPQKLFSIITQFLMKQPQEQKAFLGRNITQNFSSPLNGIPTENELVLNGTRQLISLLDPELIGYLIVSLVLDYHIIVTSSNFEILSLFAFAILSTIHPLIWPGVFIPVLPESMMDTILAPFPYIIGMHSSIVNHAQSPDAEPHILINVDERTMIFYPDMIKIPKRIQGSIDHFTKKVSGLSIDKYHLFPHYSHDLIIDCISYAVGKPSDKPKKLLKHWNINKGCFNLELFPQMVCQSQLVLYLMREIENKSESLVYKAYFDSEYYEKNYEPIISKPDQKKTKNLRQRSGTSYQTSNPKNLLPDLDKNSQGPNSNKRQISSVKLPQPINANSSTQQLISSPKSASTPFITTTTSQPQQQQQFDYIKQIESLAALFASKYENGGCIDHRFKKKDFKTNAGIETPENLSFSSKLNLYNNGYNVENSNNNNSNDNNNSNQADNQPEKLKSSKNKSKKPPFLPKPKKK